MTVRAATAADLPELERLWRGSAVEVPPPVYGDPGFTPQLQEIVGTGLAWVAEREGGIVGLALVQVRGARADGDRPVRRARGPARGRRRSARTRPRRRFPATASRCSTRRAGVQRDRAGRLPAVGLPGGAVDARRPSSMSLPSGWARRRPRRRSARSTSRRTMSRAIVKSVEMLVPRLPGRSAGSVVTQPRGGYVTVYDDVCDRDPAMLRRLAKEISTRTGLVVIMLGLEREAVVRMILIDRGGIVDEYASVPEFYAPLPPGEVVALQANPVVVERYTGAGRAAVRAAAPVASSPSTFPLLGSCWQGLLPRSAWRAQLTAGPERPSSKARYASFASLSPCHSVRRATLPVLRARSHRARREGRSATRRS